ncbi:DNA primase [archaeon]|jgi:DNA primase|nr:DNA primase [archaeon]MBT3730598.1 DNA primase [archaeon]MBT4669500.1 DNA primase [archaeon]MBT5030257.1 DNA primase [archaeon]MBT5287644.1 DNA primase [archaeon]
MGKISPVSAKYIVHTEIEIEGTVDRPDIIGAIFGQTEGLLGSDLELRELQKSGRIGRIEVISEIKSGKTYGTITIPSSLDKTETVVVAAAMETIQRIGPCNAKVAIKKIEDVRISKRNFVISRAKELLKEFTDNILPDSQEITEEVAKSVRMMEVQDFGPAKLPAGPAVKDSEEIIIVEGRADVLNLLKCGFKNAIALNGTSVPPSIIPLCEKKTVTMFVDGDRGGDLIIREVMGVTDVDFVVKAPDGKEVEELTKKEIHKALRGKITSEQAKLEVKDTPTPRTTLRKTGNSRPTQRAQTNTRTYSKPTTQRTYPQRSVTPRKAVVSMEKKKQFKKLLEDLVGTRGAFILDANMKVLGKVPSAEIQNTLRSLKDINAIVFDGIITKDIATLAEKNKVSYLVAMDAKIKDSESKVHILIKKFL